MNRLTKYGVAEQNRTLSKKAVVLQEPKKYKVFLLNDDYTPMDFVVEILQRFFYLTEESATQTMLQVHLQGKGVCGVFTRDIAATKVAWVNEFSRLHEHPLLCCMEPV